MDLISALGEEGHAFGVINALPEGYLENSLQPCRKHHRFFCLCRPVRPPKDGNRTIEIHGWTGQNEKVGALPAQVADAESTKMQEMLSITAATRSCRLQFQDVGLVSIFQFHLENHGPATQDRSAQAKEKTPAGYGQPLNIKPILLARDCEKRT